VRHRFFKNARRVVIKIGTSVLESKGDLDPRIVWRLARGVASLRKRGLEVVIVSSGAIASGMRTIGLKKRPMDLPKLQALAAIGQGGLMQTYCEAFEREGAESAQILLTWEDLGSRKRYENTRKTIEQILSFGAVPIINENDTVATEEIQFGDNDQLSAMVAMLLGADALVILSDSNGLYSDYKKGASTRMTLVESMGASVFDAVSDSKKHLSKGGMKSKLSAVEKVIAAGIPAFLADGKAPNVLERLVKGEDLGTLFLPLPRTKGTQKKWPDHVRLFKRASDLIGGG